MADKKFVDSTGVKVIKDDYVKRISEKADSSAVTNLQSTLESEYLKSATAESTYAKQETVNELAEKSGKVWFVSEDPVKTQEDLATLKDTATKGEMFIISDDENHLYVFLGEGVQGADENGFRDLGSHVELKEYLKSADADNKYAQKGTVESIQSTIDSLDDTYAKDSELTEAISGLDQTYAKITELPEALSESEIQEILQAE